MKKKSYAKLNLFLKIIGKKDGYHQLQSLFAFVDLFDEIKLAKSDAPSFFIDGEFAKFVDPKNNLLTKILDYFSSKFGISKNLAIHLTKNIPVGAGIGGGSSNAAEFMKMLNEFYELDLSKEKLREISLEFGSDIAFFFEEQAALIKGRGEAIEKYHKFNPIEILLINPRKFLATKDVFARFNGNFSQEIDDKIIHKNDVFFALENFDNDLENPAIELVLEVKEILDEAQKNGAKIAKMSGSGATCFAIFAEDKIDDALKIMQGKFPQYFIKKTRILSEL